MSAPLPFIPPAARHLGTLPMSQHDRDRLDQLWHDQQRLTEIERAYAVGDEQAMHALMAGVDPTETRESVAYLAELLTRLSLAETIERDVHSRRVPVRGQ